MERVVTLAVALRQIEPPGPEPAQRSEFARERREVGRVAVPGVEASQRGAAGEQPISDADVAAPHREVKSRGPILAVKQGLKMKLRDSDSLCYLCKLVDAEPVLVDKPFHDTQVALDEQTGQVAITRSQENMV